MHAIFAVQLETLEYLHANDYLFTIDIHVLIEVKLATWIHLLNKNVCMYVNAHKIIVFIH